jgi:hypothetical protein
VTLETRCGNTAGFFSVHSCQGWFCQGCIGQFGVGTKAGRLFLAKKVQSAKELIIHVEYRFTALSAVFIWRCT